MSENGKDIELQAINTQPALSLPVKRQYHAPTLREHGNISQHTLADPFSGPIAGDGGVGFPNVYAS